MEPQPWEDLEKPTDPLRTVKDLAAGAAGGIAQVLLGMCAVREHGNCFVPQLPLCSNTCNKWLMLI